MKYVTLFREAIEQPLLDEWFTQYFFYEMEPGDCTEQEAVDGFFSYLEYNSEIPEVIVINRIAKRNKELLQTYLLEYCSNFAYFNHN